MSRFEFVCDAQDEIEGEGPRLHCNRCQTTVHDLSAMSRNDAAALLDGQVGPMCGRLRLDAELQPIFAPPRSPVRGLAAVSAALVGAAGIAAVALAPPPSAAEASGSRPGAGVSGAPDGQALGEDAVKSRLDLLIADAVSRARGEADDASERPRHASADGQPDDGLTLEERIARAIEEVSSAHRPEAVRAGPVPEFQFGGLLSPPAHLVGIHPGPWPVEATDGTERPVVMPVVSSPRTRR